MARISAKVAGFALIVLSIGFNMWRYPAVRDMVGASPCVSQSNGLQSNGLSSATLPSGSPVPAEPPARTAPTVALKASRDEPSDSAPAGRISVAPAGPESSRSADTLAPAAANRLVPVGRLVPVVRPLQTAGDAAHRPATEQPAFSAQVIRLPPVGRTAPDTARQDIRPFPSAVIPIYPATKY